METKRFFGIVQTYDHQLEKIKTKNPELISKNGIPILNLNSESFDLDFILSGLKWDFEDSMESKLKQISGYNETVFKMVEDQYQKDNSNQEVKSAYLEQLAHKKAHLDMQEVFAWQKLGLLNFKEPSFLNDEDYVLKIENKIQSLKNESQSLIDIRLLSVSENPLLVGPVEISKNLPEVKLTIEKNLTEAFQLKTPQVLKAMEEKLEHITKMVKVREFEVLCKNDKDSVQVMLYDKDKVIITLSGELIYGNVDIQATHQFDQSVSDARLNTYDVNTVLLKYNPELAIVFQITDFISDYFEGNI
jgi:hypothetical protein